MKPISFAQEEIEMDKRFCTAAAFLGAVAGAWMMPGISASPAHAWTNNDLAGINSCEGPAVNDAATVIGNCLLTNDTEAAFVRLAASSSTPLAALPSTVNGAPCNATGINNSASGAEIIIGWCADANAVNQGVFRRSSAPATAPTQLQPLSLLDLGLLPDVQTVATKVNLAGVIVGVSINSQGGELPVWWSSTGAPTELSPPLLASDANCTPVDINDALPPSIIANCKDAGKGGGSKAVLWQGTNAVDIVLPVPTGADYCTVIKVNAVGKILGQCNYPGDIYSVAVWGAGGTAAVVLMTVGGAAESETFAVDINDKGMVAGNYLNSTASTDLPAACIWNSNAGADAVAISEPAGATGPAFARSIGNNGKIAGVFGTATGAIHTFHVESGSTTAIDDGAAYTGPNTRLTVMSRGGLFLVANATDLNDQNHAFGEAVP
jgi:hypothetical protein